MAKITLHIPTTQYGFILYERDVPDVSMEREMIDGAIDLFKYSVAKWNSPNGTEKPKHLGQIKIENGHTYKAVMNEKSQELYWLVEKI